LAILARRAIWEKRGQGSGFRVQVLYPFTASKIFTAKNTRIAKINF